MSTSDLHLVKQIFEVGCVHVVFGNVDVARTCNVSSSRFASILIWSGSAIKDAAVDETILTNVTTIVYLMGVYVVALPSMLYFMD